MSAKRPTPDPEFVDDRHGDDERDPYGIVPDGFVERWGASSIDEALRKAEQAPSTTPDGEMRRCPDCGSVKIVSKPGHKEMPNKRDEPLKCGECGAHLSSAAPSREESMPGEQATFRDVFRR